MDQHGIDRWVQDSGDTDAAFLLRERLPKMEAKLNRLDKRIRDVLAEVKEEFPDAMYYTASGGFNLILGDTHDGNGCAQQQRFAWGGLAFIGDGDW